MKHDFLRAIGAAMAFALLLQPGKVVATETPTADFIAAALADQEARCGNSLEAEYTVLPLEEPQKNSGRMAVRYIRTAGVQYLEQTSEYLHTPPDGWKPMGTIRYRYDRNTREYKSLTQPPGTAQPAGSLLIGVPQRFSSADLVETALCPLMSAPLRNAVSKGTVSETQEQVDGHVCWKVTVPGEAVAVPGVSFTLWCDPALGFCPRRVSALFDKNRFGEASTPTVDLRDYADLGNGVWFPMAQVVTVSASRGQTIRVKTTRINRPIPPEEIDIQFPSGITVATGIGKVPIVAP